MTRAFRFGVITSHAGDANEFAARARRVEDLGYSTLFMPDHLQDQWAPMVGLSVAAAVTTSLRVGSLVFANDYRHPVMLAKEAATLDRATNGRFEFGIGAGWKRSDYDGAGWTFDRPGLRIERLEEALAVMKALWVSTEPVKFAGTHYQLDGVVGTPAPVTLPHPPICIGGGGRRVLSLAAREADIVGVNATLAGGDLSPAAAMSASPAAFDEKIQWVQNAAGARFDAIELQCHCAVVHVGGDREQLASAMAPAFDVTAEDAVDIPIFLAGTVDEVCADLERRRERWGMSYWVVPDTALEPFAPVVERLAGR